MGQTALEAAQAAQAALFERTAGMTPGDFRAVCNRHTIRVVFDDRDRYAEHMKTAHPKSKLYDASTDRVRGAKPWPMVGAGRWGKAGRVPTRRDPDFFNDPYAPGRSVRFLDSTEDNTHVLRTGQVWSEARGYRGQVRRWIVPLEGPMSRRAMLGNLIEQSGVAELVGVFRLEWNSHSRYSREFYESSAVFL